VYLKTAALRLLVPGSCHLDARRKITR